MTCRPEVRSKPRGALLRGAEGALPRKEAGAPEKAGKAEKEGKAEKAEAAAAAHPTGAETEGAAVKAEARAEVKKEHNSEQRIFYYI